MHGVTTLIVGPSGTGKELVARAIGLSRYIRFDPGAQRFVEDFREGFFPLSISALSSFIGSPLRLMPQAVASSLVVVNLT
jgi:SpoVK/Ycf46/Vps4 family AAA+-type ATPase